jgi:hypothetical protein
MSKILAIEAVIAYLKENPHLFNDWIDYRVRLTKELGAAHNDINFSAKTWLERQHLKRKEPCK